MSVDSRTTRRVIGDVVAYRWRGRYEFADGEVRAHWIVTKDYCGFGLCDTAGTRLWAQVWPTKEVWVWKHSEETTDMQVIESLQKPRLKLAA